MSGIAPLDPKRPDRKCGATTRSGTPCQRPAGWGTDHAGSGPCKLHMGGVPTHSIRHDRLVAEQKVREVRAKWDMPDTVDPEEFLLDELRRTSAAVSFLDRKIEESSDHQLTHTIRVDTGPNGEPIQTVMPSPSVWVKLWQQERKHGVDVARTAMDLGIRLANHELSRSTADQIVEVMRQALEAAGGDVAAGERIVEASLASLAALEG